MSDTTWDDVGRRFTELGAQLTQAWQATFTAEESAAELRSASEKVRSALDDVADSITRVADSPDVRDAARRATSSVADALAVTLQQVADHFDRAADRARSQPAGGGHELVRDEGEDTPPPS